ncbi:MAG TPA: hypothetical protein VJR70_10415 [Stellaceae bacterium]|nr:hypothetical protein [Stellaceae bacterium]
MNPDPFSDVVGFLLQPAWTTAVFWLLLAGSVAVAVIALRTIPEQRRAAHIGNWIIRFLIGCMWWQQTLWKLPPYYTDQPKEPFGATGLAYWMGQMGKHAAIPAQADFVNNIVLPHFYLFAPVVYGLEVLTAVSLMLGLFVRLWGIIGALQILNLWLGLYSAPGEWPWTYFFLLLLMVVFALHHYGRSLGVDALLWAARRGAVNRDMVHRLLDAVT